MIRLWKASVSSFYLELKSQFIKKTHNIIVGKALKCAVHKLGIGYNALSYIFFITGIGKVTSAFTCNKKLLSRLFVFFHKCNSMPISGCYYSSHHAGSTTTYYYYTAHIYPFFLRKSCLFIFILNKKLLEIWKFQSPVTKCMPFSKLMISS